MTKKVKVAVNPKTGRLRAMKRNNNDPITVYMGRVMLQSEKNEIVAQKQVR